MGWVEIGRLVLRAALGGILRDAKDQNTDTRLEIVHLNEVSGGADTTAHLLEFDSVHGRWRADIECAESSITVDGRRMSFLHLSCLQVSTGEHMVVTWYLTVLGVFEHQKNLRDILLKGFKKSSLPHQFRIAKRSMLFMELMTIFITPSNMIS